LLISFFDVPIKAWGPPGTLLESRIRDELGRAIGILDGTYLVNITVQARGIRR
jgi:hypothetical protein